MQIQMESMASRTICKFRLQSIAVIGGKTFPYPRGLRRMVSEGLPRVLEAQEIELNQAITTKGFAADTLVLSRVPGEWAARFLSQR
jgi:hypothetical protein